MYASSRFYISLLVSMSWICACTQKNTGKQNEYVEVFNLSNAASVQREEIHISYLNLVTNLYWKEKMEKILQSL